MVDIYHIASNPITGFVGTIASLAGAVFSWYQAYKSKGAEKAAREAKDEMFKKRNYIELLQFLNNKCKPLYYKIIPFINDSNPNGTNPKEILKEIEEFLMDLNIIIGRIENELIQSDLKKSFDILNSYDKNTILGTNLPSTKSFSNALQILMNKLSKYSNKIYK